MSFNLDEFSKRAGTAVLTGTGNTAWTSGQPQALKTKQPGFLDFAKNVGQSALRIPGEVAGSVASSVAKGFQDVAGGISEAFTAGSQNNANEQYRQSIEDAGKRYSQLYASGKMSKAQYTKLSQDLIKQSQDLSGQINQQVSQMVTPQDFASGLATVGSLPFAAGSVAPIAGAGKAATIARAITGAKQAAMGNPNTAVNVAKSLIKAPVKYAVIDQPVAQTPVNMANNISQGKYGSAAADAALLASPALLTGGAKVLKAVTPAVKDALFGKSAVLSDTFGRGKLVDFLKKNPDAAPVLKQMEQFTLNQPAVKGDPARGGEFLANHLKSIGVDVKTANMNDVVKQFNAYAANVGRLEGAIKAGKVPAEAVISHDFRDAIPAVVKRLEALGPDAHVNDRVREVNKALDELGIQNETIRSKIGGALLEGATPQEIQDIAQKLVIPTPGARLQKGFIATIGPKDRATMPNIKDVTGGPEVGSNAAPVIGTLAKGLEKAGLGLKDYNSTQVSTARETFVKSIDALNLPTLEGKSAFNALRDVADRQHLTDLRQLKLGEIEQKLDITRGDARKVMGAIKNMNSDVPLSVRGIAGKITDVNYKLNQLASGYARIQSKLRYQYNPAFRAQQRIEAATLGQVATGGHSAAGDPAKTVSLMRKDGFLPGADTGAIGEQLGDIGATKITTQLTRSEEKSLARVLEATAAKNGTDVAEELKNEDTRRLLRAIVQNPRQGILSSNFAKATNLLFFPSTYNAKVAGIALKSLASQPPAVQFGVIKSINDFHNWTQTDEGIKWKAQNADLIGLVNYFTPINSIQQIMTAIGTKNPAELGVIGGLPFGVVQRVLEGQGAIPKLTSPYVDPKTGEVLPDKIPNTDKARLQQALSDILGTMFTFPGWTAGLGSKSDLTNTLTGGFTKIAPGETTSTTRTNLTPTQLRTQQVLGGNKKTLPALDPQSLNTTYTPKTQPKKVFPAYTGTTKKRGKTLAKLPGQF